MSGTHSYILRQKDTKSFSSAKVLAQGASLVELVLNGQEVISSTSADNPAQFIYGSVLAPWPNRIAGGSFEFQGKVHQLEVDEMGNAIHGLVLERDFDLVSISDDEVRLSYQFGADPGYPYAVLLEVQYKLQGQSLLVSATATNTSVSPAPFGIGFHPYFVTREPARLNLEVERHLHTNEKMIPVSSEEVSGFQVELTQGLKLDDGFEGVKPVATIIQADSEVTIRALENLENLMVYRPSNSILKSGGTCVAIEPQSIQANQFNTDVDPAILAPGEKKSFSFVVELASSASSGVATL